MVMVSAMVLPSPLLKLIYQYSSWTDRKGCPIPQYCCGSTANMSPSRSDKELAVLGAWCCSQNKTEAC